MKKKLKLWEKLLLSAGIILGSFALICIYYICMALVGPKTEEKCIPTEEQMEILRNSGSWGNGMYEMRENGMDATTRAYVETAQLMMNHLEEKYGIPFMACGGNGGPGLMGTGGYEATMYALEGEHAYEEFQARYGVNSEGEVYYEDQYYLKVHAMEVQEHLQRLVDNADLDIKVIVSLVGYIQESLEGELYEILRKNHVDIYIYGYVRPEMDEEKFNRQSIELVKTVENLNEEFDITVYRLIENEIFDQINEYDDLNNESIWSPATQERYDLRYDKTLMIRREGYGEN